MMRRAAMRQSPPGSSPRFVLMGGPGSWFYRPDPNQQLHRAIIFALIAGTRRTWRRQGPPGLRQDEAEEEAGRAAAQVGRVVDSRGGEAEEDVDRRPAHELHQDRLPLGGERAAAAEEEGDEGAEQPEDGPRGADAPLLGERGAGERAGDAGHEIDQEHPRRAQQQLQQGAELEERPAVEQEVEPSAMQEHAGDQPPIFPRPDRRPVVGPRLRERLAVQELEDEPDRDGDQEEEGDGGAAEHDPAIVSRISTVRRAHVILHYRIFCIMIVRQRRRLLQGGDSCGSLPYSSSFPPSSYWRSKRNEPTPMRAPALGRSGN